MERSVKIQFKESAEVRRGRERRDSKMRLVDFIHQNTKQIASEWETFAQTLKPAANDMTPLALRNHIYEILDFIVSDIVSYQTGMEQVKKSHGRKKKNSIPTAAETHAALRLAGGFDLDQMVSEFRALRASVIKLWSNANTQMNAVDIADLTRFNESIDQELAESVGEYARKIRYSKDLFVSILSHELRSPLNVISMSAQLLNIAAPNERQTILASQISESASRITVIVNDLLDITRARFGSGLPVVRSAMDMGFMSRQLVGEMRGIYPTRNIILEMSGDLKGEWDKARIGQMFSNLLGNALQYGLKDSAILITVKGSPEEVTLSLHNSGIPIPAKKMDTLFNALPRSTTDGGNHPAGVLLGLGLYEKIGTLFNSLTWHPRVVNLGLGLYITKEIVVSHGGTISVTSTEIDGTTFTARFPRK